MNTEWLLDNISLYHKWMTSYIDMLYWGELLGTTEFLFIMGELFHIEHPHAFNIINSVYNLEEILQAYITQK